MFCREHVAQLRGRYDEISATGATVVAIGMGQIEMAAHFRDEVDIPFPLIVDRTKETYRALELKKGTLATILGPSVWIRGVKNLLRGRQPLDKPKQDPFQMGATAIVRPGGEIAHLHRSEDPGDNYPVDELIAQLKKL